MIVVSMTSWTKRIGNVKQVVESIMANTVQPDRVYLNLSKTEFEGIELPEDLVTYFNSNERLVINWVNGENTKSMKKIFPILQYLDDDDIIIGADDDILFPNNLIEGRIKDFENYGRKYSITSNKCLAGSMFPQMHVVSAMSLYTKRMLKNWKSYVNADVIRTYNDDRTYLYILWFNGYLNKPCTTNEVHDLVKKYDMNLRETSMSAHHVHKAAGNYDAAVSGRVYQIGHNTIDKLFGYFNQKRYDCVMVYGKSGVDSKEMTCGEHLELEYVIASLKKYCKSWCGRIFIVGSEPPVCIKNDVIHIPCDDPYTHCKDANIIHKVRYACENIPDLTDDFLMISDDQIVTKTSSWNDMRPRIVRKYTDWTEEKWQKNRKIEFWHECLYQTLKLFPEDTAAFWSPHIWSPISKKKFIEMCKKYDYQHKTNCIIFTLYYNFIKQPIVKNFDHTHLSNAKAIGGIKKLNITNLDRHLSWADKAFSQKEFRDLLDEIVGFKRNETSNSKNQDARDNQSQPKKAVKISKIKSLRNDIANGRVIKVAVPGGYVWKRVK